MGWEVSVGSSVSAGEHFLKRISCILMKSLVLSLWPLSAFAVLMRYRLGGGACSIEGSGSLVIDCEVVLYNYIAEYIYADNCNKQP